MPRIRRRISRSCVAFGIVAFLAGGSLVQAADSPASVKNADQFIANGNLKAAAIELQNAIREAPQDGKLRARLARVYLQLGDPIRAEREARAAREHNAAEADYLPVLIDALLRQGKFQDLSDTVRPGNRPAALESQVRRALGLAAARQHDTAKAQTLLQDAIRLDPTAPEPKIALARLLGGSNSAEANRLLDEVLTANPRSVEALLVKGELARTKGDTKAALSDFDAALQADPKSVPARLSRASLNIAEGKYAAADQDLGPVLKSEPGNVLANYLHALEQAKQGQYAAADRLLDRLSPSFSEFPAGYYLQGATKLQLGQNAQAESLLTRYIALAPSDTRADRLAAVAALRQRAPGRAIDYLKPVAAKPNADADTLTLLGNAYMADGKADLALKQFERAAALDPKNPAIQTRVAISEIGAGQGKEGLASLERVFDTDAGAAVAGPTLVLVQLRAGQTEKAAQVAAALVKRDAKNPLYLTLSGMVKAAQKDVPGGGNCFPRGTAAESGFRAGQNRPVGALPVKRTDRGRAETLPRGAIKKTR